MGGVALAAEAGTSKPTVIELFTSQGCEQCLPADEVLGDLAGRDDIVALSLHVDYWDYIGWQDPFGRSGHTERQKAYRERLDNRFLYTPQLVIDGQAQVEGTRREEIQAAIAEPPEHGKVVQPRLAMNPDGSGTLIVPANPDFDGEATIWLALYDDRHTTDVQAGENKGKVVENFNVVREFMDMGTWTGQRVEIPLDMQTAAAKGRSGCAVLIQQDGTGPIIGATAMPLPTM